jgi:thiosulfate dehydrogenase
MPGCRAAALAAVVTVAILCLPAPSIAEEIWTVRDGDTVVSLDLDLLQRLGLEVTSPAGPNPTDDGFGLVFPIDPGSTLTFSVESGLLVEFLGGRVLHTDGISIVGRRGKIPLDNLIITQVRGVAPRLFWAIEGPNGSADGLVFHRLKAGFNASSQTLTIHSPELRIPPALAAALGDPALAGVSLGTVTTQAAAEWVGGTEPQPATAESPGDGGARTAGCDMTFCELYGLAQWGRGDQPGTEDIVGLAVATTSWNVGNQDCIWYQNPNGEHPFIIMNLFRLKDDRFEQIGQSWIKHGFYALGNHQCGGPPCTYEAGHSAGNWLGSGCTDTYGSLLNGLQTGMGPRYEVNPWTGGYSYPGSHLDGFHSHDGGLIEHRLQVHDADLDPAQNSGATYYGEGFYVMLDDVDAMNSASWKPVPVSGSPGGTWTFGMSDAWTYPTIGFAIDAWTGAQQTLLAQEIPVVEFQSPDGRCLLAAKATDLGDGTWHYEYALLNIDMDRKVDSFSIPITPFTAVTNIGFHGAMRHEEEPAGFTDDPWSATVADGAITWTTLDNPVTWGAMHNFRFDADEPPDVYGVTVTLGLFETGSPDTVTGNTIGPYQGPPDCNDNNVPDECDLECAIQDPLGNPGETCQDNYPSDCGQSDDCQPNGIPDECEADCNANGFPDGCDVDPTDPDGNGQVSEDCQPNGVPDECDLDPTDPDGDGLVSLDCQPNGIPDECDISGPSDDCDNTGVPDECEVAANDCNENGVIDSCDISAQTSSDCNGNGLPDECEIDVNSPAPGGPYYCQANCDPDCNDNGNPDECDISSGSSNDCDDNGVPDECEGFPPCNNDRCDNATVVCPGTYPGLTNENMDSDGSAGCGWSNGYPDVWYSYSPTTGGFLTISTCGAGDFDTVLSIHTGCPGVPGNQHEGPDGCDDDSCPASNRSELTVGVTAGSTYLIRVSGSDGATGSFELSIAGPECTSPGDSIRGGLLWDKWWVVKGAPPPQGEHPLYPPEGQQSGSATFRCKECHGWDYKGAAGAYGSGAHYTGIPGVFGSTMTRSEMFNLIKLDSVTNGHGYGNYGLWDEDTWDLVQFLDDLIIDTDLYIDVNTQFIGDDVNGGMLYAIGPAACIACHGPNGRAINFGSPEDPVYIGHIAGNNPWEFLHKVRMGQPGSPMPSWIEEGGTDQEATDIGRYCQVNFCAQNPDGDMDGNGEPDGTDIPLFINRLMAGSTEQDDLCSGDFNENGVIDMADVPGMVSALLAP